MILVSGATGFLGAHLVCQLLKKGCNVRAMRRENSSLAEFDKIFNSYFDNKSEHSLIEKLEWIHADITDITTLDNAFSGISEVYHCAALVSFLPKDAELLIEINSIGTANMVNYALQHNVAKFCYVSSIASLGRELNGKIYDEQTKWIDSPFNSRYAISKHKGEMEVWRGIEEGLNAVIVNPGVIIGYGDWHKGSCRLFTLPWKNFPFYTTGTNGYVDVMDVCEAMIGLMSKPELFSNRYVLVGENFSMKFFMHHTAMLMNKKKASVRVTPLIAEFAWRIFKISSMFTGKEPMITKETARASIQEYNYSSKKIIHTLDFTFTPIESTLKYICEKYISEQNS